MVVMKNVKFIIKNNIDGMLVFTNSWNKFRHGFRVILMDFTYYQFNEFGKQVNTVTKDHGTGTSKN